MAPKPKAPVKAPQPAQQKAQPTGLQLSSAQWKAYNAAYSAYATAGYRSIAAAQRRAAIQGAALAIRNSRLSAAYSLRKKSNAAHAVARTAAIAAFAVSQSYRQSRLAHQNMALQNRVFADYERHLRLLGRAQYIYKGEAAYTHTGVMRTITGAQAMTLAQAQFNNAAKTARKAVASTNRVPTVASAAVQAGARAAGLAAARSLPGPQPTVSQKARATASAKARQTASATARATAQRTIAARKKGVAKAAPAPRTAPRPDLPEPLFREPFGDPDGYDCVAAAIASHLDWHTGYRMTSDEYATLCQRLVGEPDLEHAFWRVKEDGFGGPYRLASYAPAEPTSSRAPDGSRLVAGYDTPMGPHASLLLSDLLVFSWGEILLLEQVITPGTGIEESWELRWERV